MSYFIVLLITIICGVSLAYLIKKSFSSVIAVINFLYIFLMYFSGLFANLKIGAYVFFALTGLLFLLAILKSLKKKETIKLVNIVASPSFIIYSIVAISFGIIFLCKTSRLNDELTHWALVVKNMFYYNNFGNIGDTTTMFNQYVPASGLFMYGFQIFNTTFVNGSLYSAFDLLVFSLILPVLDLLPKKKSIIKLIAGCIFLGITLIIPGLFKTNMFYNLQVDGLLAVFWAYIFLIYLVCRKDSGLFKYIAIGLASFTTVSIKTSGIALIVFSFVIIIVDFITSNKGNILMKLKNPKLWIGILIIALLIVFAKVSWSMYCKHFNVRAGWNSDELTLQNIISWIKTPTEWQTEITNNYFNTFFLGKAFYYGNFALQLPMVGVIAFIILTFIFYGFISKKKQSAIFEGIISILLLIGYGIFTLLLYLFSFSYAESERLASYPRYMLTYTAGIVMIILFLYMEQIGQILEIKTKEETIKLRKIRDCTFTSIISAIFIGSIIISIVMSPKYQAQTYKVNNRDYSIWAETVNKLDPKLDSVYYAMMNFNAVEYKRVRFISTPMQCSGYNEGGSYLEGRNASEPYTGNPFILGKTTKEEFISETSKYKYLYIDEVNNKFITNFGDLFDSEIEKDTLYLCKKENNTVRFVKYDF